MAEQSPNMRNQPDEEQGLAELSLKTKIPVDKLPLRRATDVGREEKLRAGAKEKLLAMAGFTTERVAEELCLLEAEGAKTELSPELHHVEAKGAKTELSPEQVERWLSAFKARFDVTPHLHDGVLFADVEKALRADPDAMRAFAELDQNGHKTNVFGEDAKTFEIGTCSLEAASGHRNIVFDKAAQDLLGEGETCNGNAVDIVTTIGAGLMDEDQVNRLKKKLNKNRQRLNDNSWDWLKTDAANRKRELALFVSHSGVYEDSANLHNDRGSFRAVRRVNKVA